MQAHGTADVDRGQAHATTCAEHQQPLAGLRLCPVVQRKPCRAVALHEGGGLAVAECVGGVLHAGCRPHDLAGEAAQARAGEDSLADLVGGDTLPHLRHHTRHFTAGHERHRRLDLVEPLHEEAVDEVHASGCDGDAHLPGADRRRWALLDGEVGDWPEAVA